MKGEDGQLQLSSNTTLTKAANAYINGQLAYADAIAKGVNTAKIGRHEKVLKELRELVSQGFIILIDQLSWLLILGKL